uniref:Major sperm protein n=1 Tax=Steinernema glaseri TaxID=37863 RepID=A0A1I7Y7Y6_9BILA
MAVESNNVQVIAPQQLISLDQTLICFDVEQPTDARQKLVIGRSVASEKTISWRIRTNAPTRYCVCPNSGILDSSTPSTTILVELVGNRYNPHHKLIVQAIEMLPGESSKTVWKSERVRNVENVQTMQLELSTTLLNLDRTQYLSTDLAAQRSASLSSLLEQSSTVGEERVKELESLLAMLQSDTQQMQKNVEQTIRLKEALQNNLVARNDMKLELQKKIFELEEKEKSLLDKVTKEEAELKQLSMRSPVQGEQCVVS